MPTPMGEFSLSLFRNNVRLLNLVIHSGEWMLNLKCVVHIFGRGSTAGLPNFNLSPTNYKTPSRQIN